MLHFMPFFTFRHANSGFSRIFSGIFLLLVLYHKGGVDLHQCAGEQKTYPVAASEPIAVEEEQKCRHAIEQRRHFFERMQALKRTASTVAAPAANT